MSTVKVGELNMEYYVEGSGPPLLLIMGLGGQSSSWGEPLLEGLQKQFTTIRFSNRGTGATDKPSGGFTVPQMAADAAGLMRGIGIEKAHVFGISMGGNDRAGACAEPSGPGAGAGAGLHELRAGA